MKNWFLLLFIAFIGLVYGEEEVKTTWPMVDQRVELLSIVSRLSGDPEYYSPSNKLYEKQIKTHFEPYKDHPLIDFVRSIREKPGITHGSLMQMAVSLSLPPELKPEVSLKTLEPFHWDKDTAGRFLLLLWDFYKTARCDEFFEKQSSGYVEASKVMTPLFSSFDAEWYKSFYSLKKPIHFRIFLAMGNSCRSYNLKQTRSIGMDRIFLIAAMRNFDDKGKCLLPKGDCLLSPDMKNLIHLYNYPCVRPLIVKHGWMLKKVGESFVKVAAASHLKGDWQNFWIESLSRAVTIHYVKAHENSDSRIHGEYMNEMADGYPWVADLAAFLDYYVNGRVEYPTFEDFLPKVNDFMRDWLQKNSVLVSGKVEEVSSPKK